MVRQKIRYYSESASLRKKEEIDATKWIDRAESHEAEK